MPRTLLQIINAAQGALGVPQSATVIGNTDLATTQFLTAAQEEVEQLTPYHPTGWTELQAEYNLVVSVPITTTGDLTQNSAVVVNIPSTAGIVAQYWTVSSNSLAQNTRVISVDSPTQVTLSQPATGTVTGTSLIFAKDTYPEPTGFDWFMNRTMWDRTNRWELLGPDSPQLDQWHRSGIVATGPRRHFRQIGPGISGLSGNNWRIWPPPAEITSPLLLVFEYSMNTPIVLHGVASNGYSRFWTNDDDQCLLDDRALIMGVKWRYWQQKGFNFVPMRTDYLDYVDTRVARDGAAPTLNIVKRVHPIFISPASIQDGFYPGPVGPNQG